MAPYAFENVGRFAFDVGPFVLAFLPAAILLCAATRARGSSPASGSPTARSSCFGMWAHPRYIHPTLPLFLVVAVQALWMLGSTAATAHGGDVGARVHGGAAGRDGAPSRWRRSSPDSLRVATGRLSEDAFLRRYERRYPLWDLVNREVPPTGNVLILAMIPHPYHVHRAPSRWRVPLEQGAIDYRQLATVDDLTAALAPFGVTHVVREPEEEKAAANPIGERVTRLWDELIARAEKVGESPSGALYRLPVGSRG